MFWQEKRRASSNGCFRKGRVEVGEKFLVLPGLAFYGIQVRGEGRRRLSCDREEVAVAAFGLAEGEVEVQAVPAAREQMGIVLQENAFQCAVCRFVRVAVHILDVRVHG